MNAAAAHLVKDTALAAVSSLTLEELEWLDSAPADGRASRLHHRPEQPGGLAVYACTGARRLDRTARLGLFGLVGEADHGLAHEAVEHLAIARLELRRVPGKLTNRSRVSMTPDGKRQIVRLTQPISLVHDLDQAGITALKSMIARSLAVVLGRLPIELTRELIAFARNLGTYVTLCPGGEQLAELTRLSPHALVLNLEEARQATGNRPGEPVGVLAKLVQHAAADHLIVVTGGAGAVHVAHVCSGERWTLPPYIVPGSPRTSERPMSVGCGDVLAGVMTYLLGASRRLVGPVLAREAVRLGQAMATLHYCGRREGYADVAAHYEALREAFTAGELAQAAEVRVA